MRPLALAAVVALALGCTGVQSAPPTLDAAVDADDAAPEDAGTDAPGTEDTGAAPDDTGALDAPSPLDTGAPPRDTGVTPPRDTGTGVPTDTGTTPVPPDPVSFTGALPAGPGRLSGALTVGSARRTMLVYVPRTRPASPPLLVAFHGTDDSPEAVFNESGAQALADSAGVIVVAPAATYQNRGDWDHPDGEGTWWVTYPSVSPDTNPDLLLTRAILVAAQRAWSVDPARVYLLGHSNGAFFALLAAMRLNDRVAAFASSSGGLCRCNTRPDCTFTGSGTTIAELRRQPGFCACSGAERPGPIAATGRRPAAYLAHGTGDDIVSVYYTVSLAERLGSLGYDVSLHLRDGDGHVMPGGFARAAWPFLSAHRRE